MCDKLFKLTNSCQYYCNSNFITEILVVIKSYYQVMIISKVPTTIAQLSLSDIPYWYTDLFA